MTALQGRTRRWFLILTALAAAAACNDSVAPRQLKAPNPSAIIVDGAHNGGNDDVFFLPPLVDNPSGKPGFGDPEDLNLPVDIKIICQSHVSTSSCPNFDFPPTAVMSSSDAHYMVNWDTKAPGVDPGDVYRIEIHVGSKTIAWADVYLVPNGNPKNIATQGDIPLPDGRTMPIKVRIEKGWNCADRTNKTCTTQVVGNTPLGSPVTVIAPQNTAAGQFEGNWIPYCTSSPTPGCVPQGTQVVVTIEDQTAILNQPSANGGPAPTCSLISDAGPLTHMLSDAHCVKFTTDPEFKFASPVKVAVCVHTDETTQQLLKYDVDETPRFLRNIRFTVDGVDFTALCEQGESQIGSRPTSGSTNYALAVLSKLGHVVQRFVTPKSAYALHLGVGGFIEEGDGFSYVSPARPLTLSSFGGTKQSALVGSALANPIQVRISTVHGSFDFESGFPNPLNHLPVTCSIDEGSGTFPVIEGPAITQASVFTDVNGIATCPSWILGREGTNTLRVSTPNIDDGIIAVEEVQSELGGLVPSPVTLSNNATFTATGISANTPSLVSPANLSVFDFYPRTTELTWTAVPGALSYEVGRAYCTPPWGEDYTTSCSNWVDYPVASVDGTSLTFDFVGAQPGRWRVRAIYPSGGAGPWSDYYYFNYLQ